MSASDAANAPSDQSLFRSLCATLEGKLASKICSSLQTAVTRTACASLKKSIHDVLNSGVEWPNPPSHDTLTHDAACLREFCPSIEGVVGNAVCAALKQSMSDTVCATLKKAIHNAIGDMLKAEKGAPLHVPPVEFCFSVEEVVANAVCAALKQSMSDTVCEPLKKAALHAVHDALERAESDDGYDSFVDDYPSHLNADHAEYSPKREDKSDAREACDKVVEALAKEMCSRLQRLVAEALCPLLRQRVRHTIKRHAHEMQSEHVSEQPKQTYKRLDAITSTHRIAFFVVTGLVIAGFCSTLLIPGLLSFSSPVLTLFPPSTNATASVAATPASPSGGQTSILPTFPSAGPTLSPIVTPSVGPTLSPTTSPTPTPPPKCNHVSIVVYKMNSTPCNTCAMDVGTLSQHYQGNQYVTVSGQSFDGGPNHYIKATVVETGQSQTFSIYDTASVEAWTDSVLTCK
jgi:hypothetical protein